MEINGVFINDFERIDDLHRNGYKIIQNPKNFCFGADAVLLAGFAKVKKGEQAVDLGTGTGIIPILLEARTQGSRFYGIEIQKESAELAERSVRFNSLSEKIQIINGDIKDIKNIEGFPKREFEVVTSNPPYMNEGGGLVNDFSPKAIARHEIMCTLDDVVRSASSILKFGGRFYMIHRPHRLTDIFSALRSYKLEPKTIRFVHPFVDKEPNMVLIESVKGANSMLKVLPPLVIYEKINEYTKEVYDIYYN